MPTPFESARLNLQLFDLRREPVLREARAWFLADFNPESLDELFAVFLTERSAAVRMVLGYWDMAASLVTTGAIDAEAFLAAHTEVFATFAKVQPFLAELRAKTGEPGFCQHLETVIMGAPGADAILSRRRNALRAMAKARAVKTAAAKAVPMIHVPDVRATIDWYAALGFTVCDTWDDDRGGLSFAIVSIGESELMFNSGGQPSDRERREVDLYVRVDDVDAWFARIQGRAEIVEPPHDTDHGMRECIVRDLNRFWVTFGQEIEGS